MQNLSFDIQKTKAILVGISNYDDKLGKIDPAPNNIEDLVSLLINKNIIGLSEKNIFQIINKRNDEIFSDIIDFLNDENNIAFETLLFYYVGHGIRNAGNQELYLTGTNSKTAVKASLISYNDIKQQIENSHFQRRIVIIDACYSGLSTMDAEGQHYKESEIDIKGSYTLTSSAGNEKSFFDSKNRNTFFTEELCKIMKNGLPLKKPCVSLDDIFIHLQKTVTQSKPQRKSNLNAVDFYFFHNPKFDPLKTREEEADSLFENCEYAEAKKIFLEIYYLKSSDELKYKIDRCDLFMEIDKKHKQQQQEKDLWNIACNINTISSYQKYLSETTTGKYKTDANFRIAGIQGEEQTILTKKLKEEELEKELWKAVCNINTIISYQRYLNETILKTYWSDAESYILKLQNDEQNKLKEEKREKEIWESACKKNTISSYQRYINETILNKYGLQAVLYIRNIQEKNYWYKVKELINRSKENWKYILAYFVIAAVIIFTLKNIEDNSKNKEISEKPANSIDSSRTEKKDSTDALNLQVTTDSITYSNALKLSADSAKNKKNYKLAIELYTKSAELGNAEAQNSLGNCYYLGEGVRENYPLAVNWYTKSAEQGNAKAQSNLGDCYYLGDGVKENNYLAVKWYTKSAEQGNAQAQNNLGDCYYLGFGVKKNISLAVKWYIKSAEQGNADAQNNLGDYYFNGNEVKENYPLAVKWYTKSAEQGNVDAQNSLGNYYFNGDGATKDFYQAVKWYTKSALNDDDYGQNKLGDCYYNGEGVTKDFNQAIYWYTKSALQGNADAQFHLGYCYSVGEGVTKDFNQAVYWYTKSALQGNSNAQNNLGMRYSLGEGVAKDFNQAVYWFTKAALQENAFGQNNLGDCYYNGQGVAKDFNQAVIWSTKSALQGNADAQNRLGACYYNGQGVEKNYSQALKWFTKSAAQGNSNAQKNVTLPSF